MWKRGRGGEGSREEGSAGSWGVRDIDFFLIFFFVSVNSERTSNKRYFKQNRCMDRTEIDLAFVTEALGECQTGNRLQE